MHMMNPLILVLVFTGRSFVICSNVLIAALNSHFLALMSLSISSPFLRYPYFVHDKSPPFSILQSSVFVSFMIGCHVVRVFIMLNVVC